jgi:hypothetical protein
MRDKRELWISLIVVVLISALYFTIVLREGVPAASEFFGHSLGVVGFLLMLSTETFYSLRKRVIRRPWGRLQSWLRFHIFSGIVGPYLVLLHTAWQFRGLAGVVLLLTLIVVISGFIGRYIYTAVPRTADGMVLEEQALRGEINALEVELQKLGSELPDGFMLESLLPAASGVFSWIHDLRAFVLRRQMRPTLNPEISEALERIVVAQRRSRELMRSLGSLATARRLLAIWHSVHIPLGMALFVAAFIHIGAALYYATLLR